MVPVRRKILRRLWQGGQQSPLCAGAVLAAQEELAAVLAGHDLSEDGFGDAAHLDHAEFLGQVQGLREQTGEGIQMAAADREIERKSGAWSAARPRNATSSAHLRSIAREERTPVV